MKKFLVAILITSMMLFGTACGKTTQTEMPTEAATNNLRDTQKAADSSNLTGLEADETVNNTGSNNDSASTADSAEQTENVIVRFDPSKHGGSIITIKYNGNRAVDISYDNTESEMHYDFYNIKPGAEAMFLDDAVTDSTKYNVADNIAGTKSIQDEKAPITIVIEPGSDIESITLDNVPAINPEDITDEDLTQSRIGNSGKKTDSILAFKIEHSAIETIDTSKSINSMYIKYLDENGDTIKEDSKVFISDVCQSETTGDEPKEPYVFVTPQTTPDFEYHSAVLCGMYYLNG